MAHAAWIMGVHDQFMLYGCSGVEKTQQKNGKLGMQKKRYLFYILSLFIIYMGMLDAGCRMGGEYM